MQVDVEYLPYKLYEHYKPDKLNVSCPNEHTNPVKSNAYASAVFELEWKQKVAKRYWRADEQKEENDSLLYKLF